MFNVITLNGVPGGAAEVILCHGTLKPETGPQTTTAAAIVTIAMKRDRKQTAAATRIGSGRTKTHRGENMSIVAGHHASARPSNPQRPTTKARYDTPNNVNTRRP